MARPEGSTNHQPTKAERRKIIRQVQEAALAGNVQAAVALSNFELADAMRHGDASMRAPDVRGAGLSGAIPAEA